MDAFKFDNLNSSIDDLFKWIIETPQGILAIIQITQLVWQLLMRTKWKKEPGIVVVLEGGNKKKPKKITLVNVEKSSPISFPKCNY